MLPQAVTILFPEQDSDSLDLAHSVIKDCYGTNFELIRFKTSEELLTLLNEGDYDLCFLGSSDSISGTEVLSNLKRSHPNLPCVLLDRTDEPDTTERKNDSDDVEFATVPERYARLLEISIYSALKKAEQMHQLQEEQKRLDLAKEQLEAASKAKSDFLSVISHELRTPLHPILGLTDMVREEVSQPEVVELLDIIQDCGNGLMRLIQDLLDFTSVDVEDIGLVEKSFSFHNLVEHCLDPVTMEFKARGLNLDVVYEPGGCSDLKKAAYIGDAQRIEQVISNVLSNALKFTEKGGVTLSLASKTSSEENRQIVQIEVKDTGIGISAESREHIFEPLYQVDSNKPRHERGTGLGLSICQRLVEKMKGRISVDSELGKGSTFIIEIPLGIAPEPVKRQSKYDFGIEGKVLVAEDIDANMTYICRLLNRAGLEVVEASNGTEAVKKFEADPDGIHLILMDLHMPVCDGLEATRLIRTGSEAGKIVPIIAVTANADLGTKENTVKAGMNHYITKPFRPSTLYEMLGTFSS